MISETSWQPKGLNWEIKLHLALPWKTEQPEAFHCPHPSSNKPARKCSQSCWRVVLLANPAAEEPGFQRGGSAGHEEKGSPERPSKGPFVLGRIGMCAGCQVQLCSLGRAELPRDGCRPRAKPWGGFWCFPRLLLHLATQYFRFHRKSSSPWKEQPGQRVKGLLEHVGSAGAEA